jgi:hypothetical protein
MLERLAGDRLSSIEFVADYAQLHSHGSSLSCFVWPEITIGDERPRAFGEDGYRDAFCAFIAHEVSRAEEADDAGLVLGFGLGVLTLKPKARDLVGPEIAMLGAGRDGAWAIWRPGEPPFERLEN